MALSKKKVGALKLKTYHVQIGVVETEDKKEEMDFPQHRDLVVLAYDVESVLKKLPLQKGGEYISGVSLSSVVNVDAS